MDIAVIRRDGRTDPFFDGASRDQLMIKRCAACDRRLAPDAGGCPACGEEELDWAPAAGDATLVAWAVAHGRPAEDGTAAPPAVLALVELSEGPWLHARLDGVESAALGEGLPLRAHFEHPAEGEPYLLFRPAT